jgi:hypothetical protein
MQTRAVRILAAWPGLIVAILACISGGRAASALPDADGDGWVNGADRCPYFASADQSDSDGNGIGNVCECGDQNRDGTVNVLDLVAINAAIFDPTKVTPLCDTNNDGRCNVSDIVGASLKNFGAFAYCSRDPLPRTNLVIGSQQADIRRAPTRLFESPLGNLVADAMRLAYPGAGIDGALTNSGGLRADLLYAQSSAGELPGEVTWGEVFAVLPFGNRIVIETLTGAQLQTAFLNGFAPSCNPAFPGGTGRFPQISGLRVRFSCAGTTPSIVGMWKTASGTAIPIASGDTVRIVTNDFLYAGGDGYTVLALGTNVQRPGDFLLKLAIEHIAIHSPVAAAVEGRILGP